MSKRNQGIMLAIIGTMFWGISSPFAQALFAQNVKPLWLVGARLLLAGILLSVWGFIATDKEQHKEIFKKKNFFMLILFAVFGMVPSQLTFFGNQIRKCVDRNDSAVFRPCIYHCLSCDSVSQASAENRRDFIDDCGIGNDSCRYERKNRHVGIICCGHFLGNHGRRQSSFLYFDSKTAA